MAQILILLFFYFLVLFSIMGYGRIVTLFNTNYQASSFDGLIGIAILILISYITNIFLPHNYFHNSLIILCGILFFIYDLKKNFFQRIIEYKKLILVFLIIFIGFLMYKNHDDFYYYHFPYTLILTNFEKMFGLGNLNHGFRTPSSIFYLNSLFYLPVIKYYLMNVGAVYIFGFSNLILFNIIREFLKKKDLNFILFLSLLSFIFINTVFSRFAEHGTDRSALILIFIMTIYYLKSINHRKNDININYFNEYYSKITILFAIIISLKTFYIIYLVVFLLWILEMRPFYAKYNFFKLVYKNYSSYVFLIISFFIFFTIFSNTGCLIYPATFSCFEQFSWSIPLNIVEQMNLWYEQWSKAGAGPNFRVENPELYVSKFNWLANWIKIYFFTKVTDNLFVIFLISLITFGFISFKSSKKKKTNAKYKIFYILILILFIEWFYNHPALRYGGYTLLALIFFIPLSLYMSRLKLDWSILKKRIYFLIILTSLIFVYKNFIRINQENAKYTYNPLKNAFFHLDNDGFQINDKVNRIYNKWKDSDNQYFLILNKITMQN